MVRDALRSMPKGRDSARIRALLYRKYPQYSRDAAISESDSVVVEVIPTRRLQPGGFDGAEGVGRGVATTRRACAALRGSAPSRHGSSVRRFSETRPDAPSHPTPRPRPRGESRGRPAATWDRSSRLSAAGVGPRAMGRGAPRVPGRSEPPGGCRPFRGLMPTGEPRRPGSRGALSRPGVWGAISGPPTVITLQTQTRLRPVRFAR